MRSEDSVSTTCPLDTVERVGTIEELSSLIPADISGRQSEPVRLVMVPTNVSESQDRRQKQSKNGDDFVHFPKIP